MLILIFSFLIRFTASFFQTLVSTSLSPQLSLPTSIAWIFKITFVAPVSSSTTRVIFQVIFFPAPLFI